MGQVVIENPVINSPFEEPSRHFKFDETGITNDMAEVRRPSSYFVPIARPRKTGGKGQHTFDEWRSDRTDSIGRAHFRYAQYMNRLHGPGVPGPSLAEPVFLLLFGPAPFPAGHALCGAKPGSRVHRACGMGVPLVQRRG